MCDWGFGKLDGTTLTPKGSSYIAKPVELITGQPLALTDIVVNPHDGAIYFAVGGRKTQSALYRGTYIGKESTAPGKGDEPFPIERAIRLQLESDHGHKDPKAVSTLWP